MGGADETLARGYPRKNVIADVAKGPAWLI